MESASHVATEHPVDMNKVPSGTSPHNLNCQVQRNMTEADKEILDTLKELFRNKSKELVDPDEFIREQIVKWSIYLAIFGLLTLIPIKIFGSPNQPGTSIMLSGIVGVAFTLLFIHLNVKSKNPSIILYTLTWLSLMLSLWLAG